MSRKYYYKRSKTKIFEAIGYNDLDMVKKLLPKVNKYLKFNNEYNLMLYALLSKNIEIFDYLATQMDIDYEYPDTRTVFEQIVMHIQTKVEDISRVVHLTKNINHVDKKGDTILHRLVYIIHENSHLHDYSHVNDYIERLSILVENGANPYIKNKENISPIDLSLVYLNSIKSMKILLNNKINAHVEIESLILALCQDYEDKFDLIDMLIPQVSNINELSENHSALWHAKKHIPTETDIIELLEESGALPF